jgi:hypothetical protein
MADHSIVPCGFGHQLLTCSVHNWRPNAISGAYQIFYFPECNQRLASDCTSCPVTEDPRVTVERSDAEQVRAQLYARVPRVQLPELLMGVDSETHLSWELLGRPPSAPEELVPLYAAVLVAAMGLDSTDVAMMIPGVRPSAIRRASRLLEEERVCVAPTTQSSNYCSRNRSRKSGAMATKHQAA